MFWFHTPDALDAQVAEHVHQGYGTVRARIPLMPELDDGPSWLRDAQATAIRNLERSRTTAHAR